MCWGWCCCCWWIPRSWILCCRLSVIFNACKAICWDHLCVWTVLACSISQKDLLRVTCVSTAVIWSICLTSWPMIVWACLTIAILEQNLSSHITAVWWALAWSQLVLWIWWTCDCLCLRVGWWAKWRWLWLRCGDYWLRWWTLAVVVTFK